MGQHTDVEVTQNDSRHRTGEAENDPGVIDQSKRDGQEVCNGSNEKGGTVMQWHPP